MCRLLTAAGRNVSGTLRKSVSNTEYAYRIRFFECVVDETQFVLLRERLKKEIAAEQDSLSFYRIGNNYKNEKISILSNSVIQANLLKSQGVNAKKCKKFYFDVL